MKKLKRYCIGLIAMLLINTTFCFAAEKTIEIEYEFKTENLNCVEIRADELGKGDFENIQYEIEKDGKKYSATTVNIVSKEVVKEIKKEKQYRNLSKKDVPKELKLKDGKKLELDDVSWTEVTRTAATGVKKYSNYPNRPDAPATKDISVIVNGEAITVRGELVKVEQDAGGYSIPFSVKAKFTGDADVDSYILGNVEIPNNPAKPVWNGYEKIILKNLGLPTEKYKITDGKWVSDYKTENGQTVRYAEFTGVRAGGNWTAYYRENLQENSPYYKIYNAKATYTNGVEKDMLQGKVIVTYEKVNALTTLQKILIASAAVIVVAAGIAWILYVIGKKKKEEKKED